MRKIIIIISLILLTGCYDHVELNDLAVISAISISKNADKYFVSVQVINSSKKEITNSSDDLGFKVFEGDGNSINMAFEKIISIVPKKLYLAEIQALIIDENIAKDNIYDIIEFFVRNNEFRNEFYVLISKDNNSDFSFIDKVFSKDIVNALKTSSNYSGIGCRITLSKLIELYYNKNVEIVIPVVDYTYKNSNNIIVDSIGIFKNNKLVGYLDSEDAKIYNIIMDNKYHVFIPIKCDSSNYIVAELIKPKSKLYSNHGDVIINISGSSIIRENNCKLGLNYENSYDFENYLNKRIEKSIISSIDRVYRKYNSDIYGFKDLFYKYNYNNFDAYKEDDNNYLNNIDIYVKSKISFINDSNLLGG